MYQIIEMKNLITEIKNLIEELKWLDDMEENIRRLKDRSLNVINAMEQCDTL